MILEIFYEIIADVLIAISIYFFAKLKLFNGFSGVQIVKRFFNQGRNGKKQKLIGKLTQTVNLGNYDQHDVTKENTSNYFNNDFCPVMISNSEWSDFGFYVDESARFNYTSKIEDFSGNNGQN